MKYFRNIRTAEAARERYLKLSHKLHPDHGGTDDEFRAMKQEYEELLVLLKHRALPVLHTKKKSTAPTKRRASPPAQRSAPTGSFQDQVEGKLQEMTLAGLDWIINQIR